MSTAEIVGIAVVVGGVVPFWLGLDHIRGYFAARAYAKSGQQGQALKEFIANTQKLEAMESGAEREAFIAGLAREEEVRAEEDRQRGIEYY